MNNESNEILIDSYRADIIDKIARDNKTVFTDFNDFVNEAIGSQLIFWTNPSQSIIEFDNLRPHLNRIQLEYMKKVMSEKEFEDYTKNIEEEKKKLKRVDYFPLKNPGWQRYHLDEIRFKKIEEILQFENINERFKSVKEFVDYTIELYMLWWTKPDKAGELSCRAWPYVPEKIKEEWRNGPYKETFKNYDEKMRERNNKLDDKIETKTADYKDQTSKRHEEFSTEDERLTPQSISRDGVKSFIRLCKRMPEVQEEIAMFKTLYPEHRSGSSLPYDGYPLIWEFYTRMLPVKLLVAVLADMMIEKKMIAVNYNKFREEGYYTALGLAERLSDYEKKWKIKRNEKRSTGFPILRKDMEKGSAPGKARFQEYFIGMKMGSWVKRQDASENEAASENEKTDQGLAFFDGALNAMGLVNVYARKDTEEPKRDEKGEWSYSSDRKPDWSLEIGLTKRGVDFFQITNPIFRNYEDVWGSEVFSKDESDFILTEIIPDFPLEDAFVKEIMETLSKSKKDHVSGRDIDDRLDIVFMKWLQENEKHPWCTKMQKHKSDKKVIGKWRARTMAKLSEMNQIEWTIEKKTSKPQYRIKEGALLKLNKKVAPINKSK